MEGTVGTGNYVHKTKLNLRTDFFNKADEWLADDYNYSSLCMITFDIQNFHFFNKWYGREAGDMLLKAVGDFLYNIEQSGEAICGYIGGDNFSVLFGYNGYMINKITDNLQEIVRAYAKNDLSISAAFGAYKYAEGDNKYSAVEIYDYTVDALKNLKDSNINWIDPSIVQKREEELRMLPEIINALDNNEFIFFLQPKCHLKTRKIIGSEALVRWISPTRGMVPPGYFISLLEDHGLITSLDLLIWEQVCAKIREWMDEGLYVPPISVNVSRVDILQLDVPLTFEHLTKKYNLEPNRIEIEITESAYTDDEAKIINTVNRLHQAGFKVLIDDFGSGYSSLNILKDIPADVLKLDMKFLGDHNQTDSKGNSIIESVLEMSRRLHIPSIIEGVEHEEQVLNLMDLGCEFAQGYYYYKPMPQDDFKMLITNDSIVGKKAPDKTTRITEKSHLQQFYEYFVKAADVNINSGKYTFLKTDSLHREINVPEASTIKEYAERFINLGIIHHDDVAGYIKLFDKDYLLKRIANGSNKFLHSLRYFKDGKYEWVLFEITVPNDFDPIDNPTLLFTWKNIGVRYQSSEDLLYLLSLNFHKLLRVNLESQRFESLHVNKDELTKKKGYSEKIGLWLKNFAKTGNVHSDDVENYLKFANTKKMQKHFEKSDEPLSISYRRLVGEEFVTVTMTICKSLQYTKQRPIVLLYLKD